MNRETLQSATPRRDPGEITRGDAVYLNLSGERNPLRRLALMALESTMGGVGPFTVRTVRDGQALLERPNSEDTILLSLGSLTRERPLSAAPASPLATIFFPELCRAIKP